MPPATGRFVAGTVGDVPTVDGPMMRLPGSDQFVLVVGAWLLMLSLVGLGIAVVLRWRRRRSSELPVSWRSPAIAVTLVLALLGAGMVVANRPYAFRVPEFPPVGPLLPPNSFFSSTVTDLPVAPDSTRWLDSQRDSNGDLFPLTPGAYGSVTNGVVFGIPFNVVDDSTPRYDVDIKRFPKSSYDGPIPISDPAYIQSLPAYGIDNHYVAIDPAGRRMWELLAARRWFGRWEADSAALWNLDDLTFPAWSTTASGLPLLPGVYTYDQVASGRIDHVILCTTPVIRKPDPIWPAQASDGRSADPDAPPMGAWLRLRPNAPLDALGPQARVIARAMQEHGIVISDTGGNFALRGTPDARWDDRDLRTLSTLSAEDFEVVDASSLEVSPDSMAARP